MDVSQWDDAKRSVVITPTQARQAITAQLQQTSAAPSSADSPLTQALAQVSVAQVAICCACFERLSAAAQAGSLRVPTQARAAESVSVVTGALQLQSFWAEWLTASQQRRPGRREIQDASCHASNPRCRMCGPTSHRLLLEPDTAVPLSPLLHLSVLLPPQPPAVWYETVDRVREAEAFTVVRGHFVRMWNGRPAHLFHARAELLTEAADVRLLSAPEVRWVLRVHNDRCHRQYLQQLAATANRRRRAATDAAGSSAPLADAGNEQRCFRGELWLCGSHYSAERIGTSFVSCHSSHCSLCCVTRGSLNRDATMARGRQGRGHYLSAHSSRAHCFSQTTQPQSLHAAVMVRAALGDIFTVDKHSAQDLTQLTSAPAGYDSVLASGSATGNHPMADPAVVVYNPKALLASYVIVYSV